MVRLCAEPFVIAAPGGLTAAELRMLAELEAATSVPEGPGPEPQPFHLTVERAEPHEGTSSQAPGPGSPARVEDRGTGLRVLHQTFEAEIEPEGSRGLLITRTHSSHPLEIVLRLVLSCRLPVNGRVHLHAAGVVLPEGGVAFFGPSGAGKTTIAMASPFPVLSDELVTVGGAPPQIRPSGFWGHAGPSQALARTSPLVALVELVKGPAYRLRPCASRQAWPRLMGEIRVPTVTRYWRGALTVVGSLVASIPVLTLEWSPEKLVWDTLRADIRKHWTTRGSSSSDGVPPHPAWMQSTVRGVPR
jgi:hypothetical protein